ncbi:mdh [Symbiodinium microadriaticum]|nr:mdh [Symbiodinium microadriaticum]
MDISSADDRWCEQILDMATSAEAWFGLVTAAEQGTSIRGDIAYDANGECTTSPGDALKGALRVFDRSYKGSHLALMIELIAGAMTGASMEDKKQSQNWGTLVLTIDPAEFSSLEEFQRGAAVMCDRVKNAKRLPGVADLYLPGERGDSVESENIELGSIELSVNVYEKLASMACLDATNVVTQE